METLGITFKMKPQRYDADNNLYIGAMHIADYGGYRFVRPAVTDFDAFARDAVAYFNRLIGGKNG